VLYNNAYLINTLKKHLYLYANDDTTDKRQDLGSNLAPIFEKIVPFDITLPAFRLPENYG